MSEGWRVEEAKRRRVLLMTGRQVCAYLHVHVYM